MHIIKARAGGTKRAAGAVRCNQCNRLGSAYVVFPSNEAGAAAVRARLVDRGWRADDVCPSCIPTLAGVVV